MTYKLFIDVVTGRVCAAAVLRFPGGTYIPFDEVNLDYQRYLAWLAEGNEPEPAE